eukprot:PRCOL_00005972-RA
MEAVHKSVVRIAAQAGARTRELGPGRAGKAKGKEGGGGGGSSERITMATLGAQLAALASEAESSYGRECALASAAVQAAAAPAAWDAADGGEAALESLGALLAAQPNVDASLEGSLQLRLDGLREMLDWASTSSRAI